MKKFLIKVCGITRPEDARLAAELGADMVGLIFAPISPRCVTLNKARLVVASLPVGVATVGVFVDDMLENILRVADELSLNYVQLHGDEPESYVMCLREAGYKVIRAFTVTQAGDYENLSYTTADLCLLDHKTKKQPGGTGRTFDWSLLPPAKIPNLVLAGGITTDNVEEGVRLFQPYMVDVNSGVEDLPGVKSAERLRLFFAKCESIQYDNEEE